MNANAISNVALTVVNPQPASSAGAASGGEGNEGFARLLDQATPPRNNGAVDGKANGANSTNSNPSGAPNNEGSKDGKGVRTEAGAEDTRTTKSAHGPGNTPRTPGKAAQGGPKNAEHLDGERPGDSAEASDAAAGSLADGLLGLDSEAGPDSSAATDAALDPATLLASTTPLAQTTVASSAGWDASTLAAAWSASSTAAAVAAQTAAAASAAAAGSTSADARSTDGGSTGTTGFTGISTDALGLTPGGIGSSRTGATASRGAAGAAHADGAQAAASARTGVPGETAAGTDAAAPEGASALDGAAAATSQQPATAWSAQGGPAAAEKRAAASAATAGTAAASGASGSTARSAAAGASGAVDPDMHQQVSGLGATRSAAGSEQARAAAQPGAATSSTSTGAAARAKSDAESGSVQSTAVPGVGAPASSLAAQGEAAVQATGPRRDGRGAATGTGGVSTGGINTAHNTGAGVAGTSAAGETRSEAPGGATRTAGSDTTPALDSRAAARAALRADAQNPAATTAADLSATLALARGESAPRNSSGLFNGDSLSSVQGSGNSAGSNAVAPGALTWVAPTAGGNLAANSTSTDGRIPASPGTPEFAPQLAAQVTTFVRDGLQHARLELNPTEMGPLTVQIQLDGNAARVHLAAENAQTRQALEQAMPQLAGSLRESGLTLSGGGVFEQPRQPQQQQMPSGTGSNGNGRGDSAGDERGNGSRRDSAAIGSVTAPAARRHSGVVDLVA